MNVNKSPTFGGTAALRCSLRARAAAATRRCIAKDPDGNGPAADIGQVEGGILAWHKDRQLLDTDGRAAVKNRRAMQEALPIHDSAKKRK